MAQPDPTLVETLTKELIDRGKLIEAGWVAMRIGTMPADASPEQVADMRMAYLAGAQHVFGSIINMLDPGDELTERDERRLTMIANEMQAIHDDLAKWKPQPMPAAPAPTLGDAPVEAEYQARMTAVARSIDRFFNGPEGAVKKTGFVLLVFTFGEDGRCNYMSNANRADVLATLKEQVARFEGMPEVKPGRA